MPKTKRFLSFLLLVLFLMYSCKIKEKPSDEKLTIATFNCEFLWDGLEPEEGSSSIQFPHRGNYKLAYEHMREIAGVIKEINPDIINLVEVEGIDALKMLNDTFLNDKNYHIGFVKGTDTFTGQDVALLSKYPILNIERFAAKGRSGEVEKAVSKNYVAEIKVGSLQIAIIGIHFLARPLDLSRLEERQAQADAIRQVVILKVNEGFLPIVMGDFNDYDGDEDCIDMNGHIPITNVLKTVKCLDTLDPDDDLVNVAKSIHGELRYTCHWDVDGEGDVDVSELSSIDHLLIDKRLFNVIEQAYIYQEYNPFEVSDHFPVVVEFNLN